MFNDFDGARANAAEPNVTLKLLTGGPEPRQIESLPVLPVLRADSAPTIDGAVDDACWQSSAVATAFRDAASGAPAPTPTVARLLYDDRALYVAFQCPEPAMDRLVAQQRGHDTPRVWMDDGIEMFVAGTAREPDAHIIVNTNQSVYDEIGQDPAWNPDLSVAVQKQADGWSAEIALPWADIEKAGIPRAAVMSVNLCRNRFAGAAADPHSAWSCTFGGFHVPRRFGVALLQDGPVALADLQVPGLWGRQAVAAPHSGGFCSPGDTLECTIAVNIAPADRERYRVRVVVDAGATAKTIELPAQPGQEKRVRLQLTARAVLRISLVDAAGQPVGSTTEEKLVPMAE